MSRYSKYYDEEAEEEEEDGDEVSGSDDDDKDDAFDEDMKALKRALMTTGEIHSIGGGGGGDYQNYPTSATPADSNRAFDGGTGGGGGEPVLDSESEDEMELLRSIKDRFSRSADVCEPLSMKSLMVQPPVGADGSDDDDDEEDDFETLRAVQRRFSSYNETCSKDLSRNQAQVHASGIASDNETSVDILNRANTCESFPDSQQSCVTMPDTEESRNKNMAVEPFDQLDTGESSMVPHGHSSFPDSAQALFDAIKRNRLYQRFLRSKLDHIEARIEENKELKDRIKVLRDFQVSCKKITGHALSQKKDPRVQLISVRKPGTSDDSVDKDKKVSPLSCGPLENPHVTNYRKALATYPLSVDRKNWSSEERENLVKGIRQQYQEKLVEDSVDRFSSSEGSLGDTLDGILEAIKDHEITPEMIRQFLPKVNWDRLASMYVKGRSGAECEARWLNWEDPLINHNPWTGEEDKNLLLTIQEKGITDWIDIAVSLGTNRTPFQCLARYQRSLNACILKREWTEEEDDQLRRAVEVSGEHDWQNVASMLEGRTGTQCSNRWKKALHPTRKGKWAFEEDKRLKAAVMLFGARNWNKIAHFVPGRTQVQCRERYVNVLDPSLNLGKWTEEEDSKLRAAVAEHGYSWSKVALCLPKRTDNQCWRRWKVLAPDEVPLIQEARRVRREALMRNFVDREKERPDLAISDLMCLPIGSSVPEPETMNSRRKSKRKTRNVQEKNRSKRLARNSRRSSVITNGLEPETVDESGVILNEKTDMLDHGTNTTKEKSKFKGSGKIRGSVPDAENQNMPIRPAESFESGISSSIDTFGGNNATKRKERLSDCQSRRNALAQSSEEQDSLCSEVSDLAGRASKMPSVDDHSSLQESKTEMNSWDITLGTLRKKRKLVNKGDQPRNNNEHLGELRDMNAATASLESEMNSWDDSLLTFKKKRKVVREEERQRNRNEHLRKGQNINAAAADSENEKSSFDITLAQFVFNKKRKG